MHYFCYRKSESWRRDSPEERAWEPRSKSVVTVIRLSGAARSITHLNGGGGEGASDLQFVLHHVEGVVGKVDLLDAVDDLLLRLRVDGLLPQLP